MRNRRHRLAAVWFADIVGYSALASRNEEVALRLIEALQELAEECVRPYGGRVVKFMGDGVLAEFGSTGAAVRSADELARRFRDRGAKSVGEGVDLRIGVHLGDLVTTEDDIYGEGVNLAARLQSEARPGEILVSREVWQQLHQRQEFRFEPAGAREVKGFGEVEPYVVTVVERRARPRPASILSRPRSLPSRLGLPGRLSRPREVAIGVLVFLGFAVLVLTWDGNGGPPREAGAALASLTPAPSDRAVAVLPFENLSEDADEYFSDGITEEIRTALARVGDLRVVGRTSVMRYKGTEKTGREIGRELGVGAFLTGSVQQQGGQVRITVQLVDTRTDAQLWADRYDRDLNDVFAVQSDIAREVVRALEAELSPEERERLVLRATTDTTAYKYYLRALDYFHRGEFENAVLLYGQALEVDPEFALAHAGLATAYAAQSIRSRETAWRDSARAQALQAIALAPDLADGHAALGHVHSLRYEFVEAMESFTTATRLEPNNATALLGLGVIHFLRGRFDEAVVAYRRAFEVEPASPLHTMHVGLAYAALGLPDEAARWFRGTLDLQPDNPSALNGLAEIAAAAGRPDEAARWTESMLSRNPELPSLLKAAGDVAFHQKEYRRARARYERVAAESVPTNIRPDIELAYLDRSRARERLEPFQRLVEETMSEASWDRPLLLARVHAVLGERDAAGEALEEAYRLGWRGQLWTDRDPILRESPAFDAVLKRLEEDRARMRAALPSR